MSRGAVAVLLEQTRRALWEVENVIACVDDELWSMEFCGQPVHRHIYHMLHSLDRWLINPAQFTEPDLHELGLDNLDQRLDTVLSREQLRQYFDQVSQKVIAYLEHLEEEQLYICPPGCRWSRLALVVGQHRHLHTHMGMLMGFVVAETGRWPKVLGLEGALLQGKVPQFY